MGQYDGQKTSADVGHPPIPRVPPGYPSSAKGKAAGDAQDRAQSPTAGAQRKSFPSSA